MNWLLKVARQAEPAHLLNTHTHTHRQQNTQTQIQWKKCVAPVYISLLSRVTVQLDLNTCGGSLNLSWLRSCIQDPPKQSCVLTFKTIWEPTVSTACASYVLSSLSSQSTKDNFSVRHLITLAAVLKVILKERNAILYHNKQKWPKLRILIFYYRCICQY